jgi:hypothetical protein
METSVIRNAVIDSVSIDMGDRGLLTAWLFLDYGGMSQGFGGYSLYLPKSYKHHADACQINLAGHFIFRCMEIAGVERWADLKGKTIRVKSDKDGLNASILAIGHIVKDDWFNPSKDYEEMKNLKPVLN